MSQNNNPFKHFVPNNTTRTCEADEHATPFNNQIRGVNLGGWMVLEPWITPSLFYQFLGKDETTAATDIYSFCKVLGAKEANRQLRRHWESWVTKDIIEQLKNSGAVNSLRLPVGDWMYVPYGPYIGCTDGALDYVDDLLDWAYSNGLTVLIDVHGVKGSQNGFDNSGQSFGFEWTSLLSTVPAGDITFEHWPIRSAGWMGDFDRYTGNYTNINRENIDHALQVIETVVFKYKDHPAVLGLEPVNEPWQYTPIEELKQFYWEGYLIVKRHAPYWKYIMHDSFRFEPSIWGGFMNGCPDRALDTHIYQAWKEPSSREFFYANACNSKKAIATMEKEFGPVIVGEWSLATDNCAMWLNGFNDNLPGFPRLPCKYIPCSDPYMGFDQPGTPIDPGKPAQGPYGTGMSTPIFGLCPVGRDWLKESSDDSGKAWMKAPPEAPPGMDASDEVMRNLAIKKINSFSGIGHGFYFWNFRTDVYEPHWSYISALERGWIPSGNLKDDEIVNACHKEDNGLYLCISRRDQLESHVRQMIEGVLDVDGSVDSTGNNVITCHNSTVASSTVVSKDKIMTLSGDDLYTAADCAYNLAWQTHRVGGMTCDFGGTATLVEVNRTFSNMDNKTVAEVAKGTKVLQFSGLVIFGIMVGGIIGFFLAMRYNRKFNYKVSHTRLGRSLRSSTMLSKSFGGFSSDYMEIPTTTRI